MTKILVEAAEQCKFSPLLGEGGGHSNPHKEAQLGICRRTQTLSSWESLGFVSPKQPQTWLQGRGDPREVAEKRVPPC